MLITQERLVELVDASEQGPALGELRSYLNKREGTFLGVDNKTSLGTRYWVLRSNYFDKSILIKRHGTDLIHSIPLITKNSLLVDTFWIDKFTQWILKNKVEELYHLFQTPLEDEGFKLSDLAKKSKSERSFYFMVKVIGLIPIKPMVKTYGKVSAVDKNNHHYYFTTSSLVSAGKRPSIIGTPTEQTFTHERFR